MSTYMIACAYDKDNDMVDIDPFKSKEYTNYSVFGFLADVRNYSNCPVIFPRRGLPDFLTKEEPKAVGYGFCYEPFPAVDRFRDCISYVTIDELIKYDYSQEFFDKRDNKITTLLDFLPKHFFDSITDMDSLGIITIVYGFSI